MDDETREQFAELAHLFQETQLEVRAMRELLIERKLIGAGELEQREADVRKEEFSELKTETLRRAYEKLLKTRLKQ